MEYFWLKEDERNDRIVLHNGLMKEVTLSELMRGNLGVVPDFMGLTTGYASKYDEYTPILSRQLFMVNEDILKLFKTIKPNLKYKTVGLSSEDYNISHLYFIPEFNLIEANAKKEKSQTDPKLTYIIVNKIDLPERSHSFYLLLDGTLQTIVSLPLAEMILRRNFSSIRLERVICN